jgi:hypothetical protein
MKQLKSHFFNAIDANGVKVLFKIKQLLLRPTYYHGIATCIFCVKL